MRLEWIGLDVLYVHGTLWVIHDSSLDRTTNARGRLRDVSVEVIRRADAGMGERIPTLDEVLDLCQGRIDVNIELKGEGTAQAVVAALKTKCGQGSWTPEEFIVSSFDHSSLVTVKSLWPALRVAPLVYGVPHDRAGAVEALEAYSFHCDKEFVTAELIADAHAKGARVYVYTVNTRLERLRIEALGADGVFSDHPQALE